MKGKKKEKRGKVKGKWKGNMLTCWPVDSLGNLVVSLSGENEGKVKGKKKKSEGKEKGKWKEKWRESEGKYV